MRARSLFRAGFLAVLAWGWCAGAPAQGPTVWQDEIVDYEGVPGIYHALAVDAAGRPHLVYLKSSRSELWYARWTGSAWVKTKITDVAPSGMVRAETVSMALDGAGTPHVAFFENGTGKLRYARRTATGWQVQSVAGGGVMVAGEHNSIAVDGAGRPYILYSTHNTDTLDDGIRCVYWTGSAWQYRVVSASTEWDCDSTPISIAVDRNGTAHALYFCEDDSFVVGGWIPEQVRYATWSPGTAIGRGRIDYSLYDYYQYGHIELDRDGQPHAIYNLYRAGGFGDVRHARRSGASWSAPATLLSSGAGYGMAGMLNNGSQPCAAYTDSNFRQLFGWRGGPTWSTSVVQPTPTAGDSCRLAKGPDGRIFLSYYYHHYDVAQSINRAELRLAQSAPGLWFGAVNVGGGWKWLDWFGYYNDAQSPWMYHKQHGWLYPFGVSTEAVTFWDARRGLFWWTKHSRYPYLYRFTSPGWMWYQRGSTSPRRLLNCATGQWEQW